MDDLNPILEQARRIFADTLVIWNSGGWAMYGIALIALLMFTVGMHVHLRLRATGFSRVSESTWRRWLQNPRERRGPVGALLDYLTSGISVKEAHTFFEQLQHSETRPYVRDLRLMKVCVSASPLVGLLGTVWGMLATFGALAGPSSGDQTMGLIAAGISTALVTTETGLVIAIPGLFFQYQLARGVARYRGFLAQLQSACIQHIHRTERQAAARREALRLIRERLLQGAEAVEMSRD